MNNINVLVQNKVATASRDTEIVCGNSDYTITFSFDSEWDDLNVKTARFSFHNKHVDVVFEGNTVNVPILSDVNRVFVGVFAGDLHTTTPARIDCKRSILCNGGVPVDPPENVYSQIMNMIQNGGTVKTVNGVAPDESGNVAITIPDSESSGGGVAFKSFDLKLSDDTTMRLVDMGNDMVCISFVFSGKKTMSDFVYTIPTDNAEFNTWFSGKVFYFTALPLMSGNDTTEGGLQGTYGDIPFIVIMGAHDTEFGGSLMLGGNRQIKGNIDTLMFTVVTRAVDTSIFA